MQAFAIDPVGSQSNPYTKSGPDKEIRICHVGNKGENYVVNTPAWDSIDTAHSLENHNQDIIPSFWYLEKVGNDLVLKYDAGRNWENNTLSQEIWRNNCAGSPTALLTVKKVLVDEPQGVGADDFSFKITGANDFSANYSFDSDATNEVALQLSNAPFTVVENEANGTGYTTGSVGCTAVELTMNGATCTITNTYEEGPVLCTDTTANNYNQEGSCTYDSDVTICKLDNNQNPLSGWTVSLTQGDVVKSGVTAVETGCVTLQDVPYGAYTLGETMQANWENVSGNGTQVTVDGLTESFSLVNKYPGCTTVGASNYNAAATFNNGTCEFPPETEIIKACKYNSETEGALAGWEMTISNDKVGEANVTFTGVTGENGCYSVAVDPLDGPFFVTEEDRAGWTQNTTEVTGGAVNEGQDGMEYCTFFAPVQSTQENTFSAAAIAEPEYRC